MRTAIDQASGPVIGPFFLAWREYERQRARAARRERLAKSLMTDAVYIVMFVIVPAIVIGRIGESISLGLLCAGMAFLAFSAGKYQNDWWAFRSQWDDFNKFASWLEQRSDEELLADARQWAVALSVDLRAPRSMAVVHERNAIAAECWRRGILDRLQDVPFAFKPGIWRGGGLPP